MSTQTTSACKTLSQPHPTYSADHTVVPVFITVITLLVVACYFSKRPRDKKKTVCRLPPGPPTLPVIGNMHQMVLNKPAVFRWIHRLLADMGTQILCLRFGRVHVIAVACPEMAREVLRKNDAAFASRPATFASGLFSFGYKGSILSPHGEQWKKMRRVITAEVLSPAMEQRLHCRRKEEADHLLRYVHHLCSDSGGRAVDVRHVAQHFCGNMIRSLVFGKRYLGAGEAPAPPAGGGPGPDEVEHVGALFRLLNYVYSFCVSDYFPALVGLDLDGHEKVAMWVTETLNRLHDPLITERIHQCSLLRKAGTKIKARDFLDVLVSLEGTEGQPLLSFEEIRAQTAEIMFAVVDNPSNAVEWALAELMNKPEVMQKAMDELDAVVGKNRLVEESDIPQLNYLKSCIREAFRMHPYHAFNPPHVATEDTTISGYAIPKGSHVLLSRVGLGRNPGVWDVAQEFRPERHMDDHDDAPVLLTEPSLRFISFSSGRRGCPGVSLGTSVTMMLFARILQGFTWTKPPGVDKIELLESATSLALAEPLKLQAQPRLPVHFYGLI